MKYFLSFIAKELVSLLPKLVASVLEYYKNKKEDRERKRREAKVIQNIRAATSKDDTTRELNKLP